MRCECLDFRKLPGQNPLFLAYLFDFPRVHDFFTPPATDPQSRASQVLERHGFPRHTLISALEAFNRRAGCGDQTLAQLELLGRDGTVAAVSGQQVGLFGGASYTLYKAASAVRQASRLREAGIAAVPVFWLAADDSDFDEVRSASFVGPDGRPVRLSHADTRASRETMAGWAPLQPDEQLNSLETAWDGFPFAAGTIQLLRNCYQEGRSFRDAFARLMSETFREQGLILLDSTDPALRSRLGAFLEIAVLERETVVGRLLERSRDLREAGFEPQVAVDESETLLFWVDGQQRYKLEFRNGRYQAKKSAHRRFSPDELARVAREEPERLGFNALLRPILQDFLLPTAVYFGGPAEVAYFAQVDAIAGLWNVKPLIRPRSGFTMVDRKSQRLLEKYGLSVEEVLLSSQHQLAERILRQGDEEEVLTLFSDLDSGVAAKAEALRGRLQRMDPPLVDMLDNALSKVSYQIEKVQSRFVANRKNQAPHLEGHLSHLAQRLHPGGGLQERHYAFPQLLAEEGPEIVRRVLEQCAADCPSHHVCHL